MCAPLNRLVPFAAQPPHPGYGEGSFLHPPLVISPAEFEASRAARVKDVRELERVVKMTEKAGLEKYKVLIAMHAHGRLPNCRTCDN